MPRGSRRAWAVRPREPERVVAAGVRVSAGGLGRGQAAAAAVIGPAKIARTEGGESGAEGPGGSDASASRVRGIPDRCRRLPAARDGRISQASRSGCVWRYFA